MCPDMALTVIMFVEMPTTAYAKIITEYILTLYDEHSLVLSDERFQLHVSSHCQELIERENVFTVFLKHFGAIVKFPEILPLVSE